MEPKSEKKQEIKVESENFAEIEVKPDEQLIKNEANDTPEAKNETETEDEQNKQQSIQFVELPVEILNSSSRR